MNHEQRTMATQRILTIKDVAESLKISEATTLRWIKAKKINGFFRIGRKWLIRESDFNQLLANKINEN